MKLHPILVTALLVFASPVASGADSTLANGTPVNISIRARSGPGNDASICGFVIKEAATFALIRAVGPALAQFGVTGYASGTMFSIFDSNGALVTAGTPFSELPVSQQQSVNTKYLGLGAFPLPTNSADSYTYICLNPGSYTVVANPTGSSPGIILTEVYFDSSGIGASEPTSFDTLAAAVDYVNQLFAGGKAEIIDVGTENVLVVQKFGSGVPVVSIATYRLVGGRWILASEWEPQVVQFYTVEAQNGDVVAVGDTTGRTQVLLAL